MRILPVATTLVLGAALLLAPGDGLWAQEAIRAKPTAAPGVPPPIARTRPAKVLVELTSEEHRAQLADGVEYEVWTFGGTLPGPFIRVRVGDEIELRLKNDKASKFPHSIDLHAVTGPGGGAVVTQTIPGGQTAFRWKAMNPGLYVYHCATPPVPLHVANGMYGLILVEPQGGLPPVDKEFYILQSEFYTQGRHGEEGFQAFSMEKAEREQPDYVLFNGRVGSLLGERALKAKVGDRVRLFVGNAGPNLVSSFHVIGEIFDAVYPEGAIGGAPNKNIQSTVIPAGGAAIVEFRLDAPGTYLLVDHSIFRAFGKGALGALVVTGPEAPEIFKGLQAGSGPTGH
ncbi:MAG: nitrite reductase, copper-containing [candidate division NC10 bacterium]|nr:nitrite reductase, copper-containing [candidate division NC10 bacterium]